MSEGMIIRRGGGGSLSPNAAVLAVTAPVGSTITISKSGTSKTQDASKGHTNSDDNSVAVWYFSIGSSNFGTWTVTATLGSDTASGTIVVDAVEVFGIVLDYGVLYDSGRYSSRYNHTFISSSATVTDADNYVQISQTATSYYGYVRWESVDLTNYSTIVYTGRAYDASSSANGVFCYIFATQNSSVTLGKNATVKAHTDTKGSGYTDFTVSIDVSELSGLWYVAAGSDTDGGSWGGQRKTQVVSVLLER